MSRFALRSEIGHWVAGSEDAQVRCALHESFAITQVEPAAVHVCPTVSVVQDGSDPSGV